MTAVWSDWPVRVVMSGLAGSTPPPLATAFKDRNVLLTGHTGFKGSWLSLWLHELGARLTGFSLDPPTPINNFQESRVSEVLVHEVRGDIRDRDVVSRALDVSQPDVLFHLAAQTVVRQSYVDPLESFSSNVMGTAAILDAVRLRGMPCAVVVVSSDKCYANDESGRLFTEDDPLGGHDPYSASKAAVEIVTAAYRDSFFPAGQLERHGVAVATARAGNVIGGGDWTPDGLVADVMQALRSGTEITLRNPKAVRPWQHVLEALSGYLTLGARLLGPDPARFCGAWNFGPDEADFETVAQLVDRLVQGWGSGGWQVRSDMNELPEANVLRLSSAKAKRELGWHGRWGVAEAVERTVAWYRRYDSDPAVARDACLADIAAYAAWLG